MIDLPVLIGTRVTRILTSRRFRLLVLCLSFCMPASMVRASPLDPQAQYQARQVADATPWQQPGSRDNRAHPLGIQTLSIEKPESKKKPESTVAIVYQYHYGFKQARMLTIDTDHARLLKSQPVDSVHLPLSQVEIDYASRVLQRHTDIIDQLRGEQRSRGHSAFLSVTELEVKASIYEPLDASHDCHQQRCALLSLFDDTQTVFSTEPVVNLLTMQAELLGNR